MPCSLLYALLTEIEVILRLVDCESKTFGNNGPLFNGLKKKGCCSALRTSTLKSKPRMPSFFRVKLT